MVNVPFLPINIILQGLLAIQALLDCVVGRDLLKQLPKLLQQRQMLEQVKKLVNAPVKLAVEEFAILHPTSADVAVKVAVMSLLLTQLRKLLCSFLLYLLHTQLPIPAMNYMTIPMRLLHLHVTTLPSMLCKTCSVLSIPHLLIGVNEIYCNKLRNKL